MCLMNRELLPTFRLCLFSGLSLFTRIWIIITIPFHIELGYYSSHFSS